MLFSIKKALQGGAGLFCRTEEAVVRGRLEGGSRSPSPDPASDHNQYKS